MNPLFYQVVCKCNDTWFLCSFRLCVNVMIHESSVISGCGKSALVANWAKRTQARFPDAFMFVHFIGSSAESAGYLKLLRRSIYLYIRLLSISMGAQLRVPGPLSCCAGQYTNTFDFCSSHWGLSLSCCVGQYTDTYSHRFVFCPFH